MAATGARGDSSLYEEEDKSGWVRTKSPIPEASAPASEADFVRAVRNCRLGNKPYFRKGDILRVINKARRSGLSGELK